MLEVDYAPDVAGKQAYKSLIFI